MKITIEYCRVSTAQQVESGLGLEAQERRNGVMLLMLEEPTYGARFVDHGVSAGVPFASRSGGAELMAYIERVGGHDVELTLVAYSLDRLFRDVDDGRAMLKWFDDHGVKVLLSNEGGNAIDVSSAMGRFLVTIRLAQGELERGLTGERTKAALGVIKARGGKIGEAPYGWRAVGNGEARHLPDPAEQAVIAEILDLDATGKYGPSAREIARILNQRGRRTRDSKDWTHTQVLRILERAEEAE